MSAKRWSFILPICALIVGLLCSLVPAQTKTDSKTPATTAGKVEGWANVPGGQVWLRPGIDAYEHDTGLVRDMRTGQKSAPITPQSLAYNQPTLAPAQPFAPYPITPPAPPRSPYQPYQPYALPSVPPPAYSPNYRQPYQYGGYGYDWGPNNVYYNGTGQPCNGCGAKLGSPGSINQRWARVQ